MEQRPERIWEPHIPLENMPFKIALIKVTIKNRLFRVNLKPKS